MLQDKHFYDSDVGVQVFGGASSEKRSPPTKFVHAFTHMEAEWENDDK